MLFVYLSFLNHLHHRTYVYVLYQFKMNHLKTFFVSSDLVAYMLQLIKFWNKYSFNNRTLEFQTILSWTKFNGLAFNLRNVYIVKLKS